MQIIETIVDFRAARIKLLGTVGLVPTMGYLHDGHLELVRRAHAENDRVVVSIFVNPTQFGPNEDFANYPRDLDHDLAVLREADTTLLFMPTVAEMYPLEFQTSVKVMKVAEGLEGERRPGHFRGVATVVNKLFNIVQPDRAYFGQKDAQQAVVIRRMVADLAMPLEVVVAPIVRAPDGLALSSRNSYLTPEQRLAAPILYRALSAAKTRYDAGERSPEMLRTTVKDILATEPMAQIDYVSAADAETLQELHTPTDAPILLSIAVKIGKPRLLDNIILGG